MLEGRLERGLRLGWEGQDLLQRPRIPLSLPQEPEVQAAQVCDVPATSQRPEQVSGAVVGVLGPCPPGGPDTPAPTGLCLPGHEGSSRAGAGVSSGTAGGSEPQH